MILLQSLIVPNALDICNNDTIFVFGDNKFLYATKSKVTVICNGYNLNHNTNLVTQAIATGQYWRDVPSRSK